jgi:hypothetical protein
LAHPSLQLCAELLIARVELLQLTGHELAALPARQALQAAVQAGLNLQQVMAELLDPQVVDLTTWRGLVLVQLDAIGKVKLVI